jgi:hypothetical protein
MVTVQPLLLCDTVRVSLHSNQKDSPAHRCIIMSKLLHQRKVWWRNHNECQPSLTDSPFNKVFFLHYFNTPPIYNYILQNTKLAAHTTAVLARPAMSVKPIKKSSPTTGLDRPTGFQEVEAPRLLDNLHMKVVRLSALRTGRVYPPGNIPGTHFC